MVDPGVVGIIAAIASPFLAGGFGVFGIWLGKRSDRKQAAEEAGMSVEQYRQYQQMQQENARLRAAQEDYYARQRSEQQLHSWMDQAEAMKQDPLLADFDLPTEINTNPDFLALLHHAVRLAMFGGEVRSGGLGLGLLDLVGGQGLLCWR